MANIVSQLVAFSGSIIYVHLMNQQQFGIYAFAYTIISFFLLLNGFGAASGVLQFVSAAKSELEGLAYFKYALRLGVIFNGGLALGIFLYATFIPMPLSGATNALYLMALFPIGRLYIDVVQAYLRATSQNRRLAKFAISVNLILLFINIGGIYCNGLSGFIISTYIAYAVIISLSIFIYKLPNVFNLQVPPINQKMFVGYSAYIAFGNAFSQLLFILDIIILGYIIRDAHVVAIYKVATVIPFAINFIPGIVSSFFYPYFAKNAANINYIKQLKRQLQQKMFIFSFIVSLLLIILAKPIIIIIFGEVYHESIIPFQILSFGFWILATFRNINGNILASLGQAKFAMWLNIGIVIINIILTCVLVTHFGIIGAAVGVVIIYILSSTIAAVVLNRILRKG